MSEAWRDSYDSWKLQTPLEDRCSFCGWVGDGCCLDEPDEPDEPADDSPEFFEGTLADGLDDPGE